MIINEQGGCLAVVEQVSATASFIQRLLALELTLAATGAGLELDGNADPQPASLVSTRCPEFRFALT